MQQDGLLWRHLIMKCSTGEGEEGENNPTGVGKSLHGRRRLPLLTPLAISARRNDSENQVANSRREDLGLCRAGPEAFEDGRR